MGAALGPQFHSLRSRNLIRVRVLVWSYVVSSRTLPGGSTTDGGIHS